MKLSTEGGIPYTAITCGTPSSNPSGVKNTLNNELLYIKNNYATKAELPEDGLPTIETGDAGKVLAVNSTEDGTEWITASGGSTYTAGTGIDISNDKISIDSSVVALQSDIPDVSGFATTTALNNGLAGKQNTLTAGSGISIQNDVISATSGGGSIQVDGVSIVNDNGTYKTAIGGGTVVTPTVDYLSNASGTTTVAMNQSSNLTQTVNFSTGIPANATFDVTYTLINHSDNDATTTITTNFET